MEEIDRRAEELERIKGRCAPAEDAGEMGGRIADEVLEALQMDGLDDVWPAERVRGIGRNRLPVDEAEELQQIGETRPAQFEHRDDQIIDHPAGHGRDEILDRQALGRIGNARRQRRDLRDQGACRIEELEKPIGKPHQRRDQIAFVAGSQRRLEGVGGGVDLAAGIGERRAGRLNDGIGAIVSGILRPMPSVFRSAANAPVPPSARASHTPNLTI